MARTLPSSPARIAPSSPPIGHLLLPACRRSRTRKHGASHIVGIAGVIDHGRRKADTTENSARGLSALADGTAAPHFGGWHGPSLLRSWFVLAFPVKACYVWGMGKVVRTIKLKLDMPYDVACRTVSAWTDACNARQPHRLRAWRRIERPPAAKAGLRCRQMLRSFGSSGVLVHAARWLQIRSHALQRRKAEASLPVQETSRRSSGRQARA